MMLGAFGAWKLTTQTDTGFSTSRFKGLQGYIDPIISEHIDYLYHYHVVLDQNNTALGKWARRAIRDNDKPVLYIRRNGGIEWLPQETLETGRDPYAIDDTGLFVRLDKLPYKYWHSGAADGGSEKTDEFLRPYERLKTRLARDTEQAGFPKHYVLSRLLDDPSIATGMVLINPENPEPTLKQVVQYAMTKRGLWDPSFEGLLYSSDNCIENYPANFDYSLLIPVMQEFGGWLDFCPGTREVAPVKATSMGINFTTIGKDENGIKAIVKSAWLSDDDKMTPNQRSFVKAVYTAYGFDKIF